MKSVAFVFAFKSAKIATQCLMQKIRQLPVAVTPQETVKVNVDGAGNDGLTAIPALSEENGNDADGHMLGDVDAQLTVVQLSPAVGASLTMAPAAESGPRLAAVMVYVVVLPATTGPGALAFVMDKFAANFRLTKVQTMLLPDTAAAADSKTLPPLTPLTVGVAVPAPKPVQVIDSKVKPAGAGSVIVVGTFTSSKASVCPVTVTPGVTVDTGCVTQPLLPVKVNVPVPPLETLRTVTDGTFASAGRKV